MASVREKAFSLTEAILDPNQTLSGSPEFIWAVFQIVNQIPAATPAEVLVSELEGISSQYQVKQMTGNDGLLVFYP